MQGFFHACPLLLLVLMVSLLALQSSAKKDFAKVIEDCKELEIARRNEKNIGECIEAIFLETFARFSLKEGVPEIGLTGAAAPSNMIQRIPVNFRLFGAKGNLTDIEIGGLYEPGNKIEADVDLSDGELRVTCSMPSLAIKANFDMNVRILPIILPVFAKKGESGNRIQGSCDASLQNIVVTAEGQIEKAAGNRIELKEMAADSIWTSATAVTNGGGSNAQSAILKIINRILEDSDVALAASEELEQSLSLSFRNVLRFMLKKSFEVIGSTRK